MKNCTICEELTQKAFTRGETTRRFCSELHRAESRMRRSKWHFENAGILARKRFALTTVLLVVLSGCAPRIGEFSCENTLWTSETPLACDAVAYNLDVAEVMFGRGARKIPVFVVSDSVLPEGSFGNYDVRWGVSLDCTGLSFGHEVLHKLELDEGIMTTFAHPQWEDNGNANLAQTYVNRAVPLRCEDGLE